MESEVDDLRKLAIRQSLKLIKIEESVEQLIKDKDQFRKWYHEERAKSQNLESEIAILKENLKRVMEIPGFDPNVRAVSERQQ